VFVCFGMAPLRVEAKCSKGEPQMNSAATQTGCGRMQDLVERALDLSQMDDCVVIAREQSHVHLRWANNAVISNGSGRSRLVTVASIRRSSAGTAVGVVSQTGVTLESLNSLIEDSEASARLSAPARDAQPLILGDSQDCNWDDPAPEIAHSTLGELVPALVTVIACARRQGQSVFGYADCNVESTFVGNSAGLRAKHDEHSGYIQLNLRSADHAKSVWIGATSTDLVGATLNLLFDELQERFRWIKSSRRQLPAGRYETILAPQAVADLMVSMYEAMGAQDAYDGKTVFSHPRGTRIGERLTSTPITLRSDPKALGLQCLPFVVATSSHSQASVFDNGLPLQTTRWIDQGVLTALTHTRHSAEVSGSHVTPRIGNLIMEGPAAACSPTEIIRNTARGLLVSCIWYLRELEPHSLLMTGLTRDGVFLIEDGMVAGAVNNFRFNESPVALLDRIKEVGSSEMTLGRETGSEFPRVKMPWLKIENFNMSSTSDAS
jgi:predicted Zn-dependent protease